eukprot:TRINITY_DN190_c0_g1_i2.p1 TRINITY_DN190_c0_g1~~TRINITY_DN190_c0_g1_i2.p1  ORF type:complete len:906 (-),score=305.33 TRINITY_DN190_c0_g1_i2:355-2955(-)
MEHHNKHTEKHVVSERVVPKDGTTQRVLVEQPHMGGQEKIVVEKHDPATGDTIRVIKEGHTSGITGAMKSIGQGQVPTNADFQQLVTKTDPAFERRLADPTLPSETKKVIGDTQAFLHAANQTMQSVNQGGHIQNLAMYAGQAGSHARSKAEMARADPNLRGKTKNRLKQAKGRGRDIGYGAYTVAKLSVRNSEFRRLVVDIIRLVQEIFLRTVQQRKGGYSQHLTGATTIPTAIPVTGTTPAVVQVFESTAQPIVTPGVPVSTYSSGMPGVVPVIEGNVASATTIPDGYDYMSTAPLTSQYFDEYEWAMPDYSTSTVNVPMVGQTVMPTTTTTTSATTGAWTASIPQSKKHELAQKVLELLRRFNQTPQFQTGLTALMQSFNDLERYTRAKAKTTPHATSKITNADRMYGEVRSLLNPYAPNKDLGVITSGFNRMFADIRADQRRSTYFSELRLFLDTLLASPEYMDEETAVYQIEDFIDRGREMFSDYRYRSETRILLDNLRTMYYNISTDSNLVNLKSKTQTLIEDFMWVDESGRMQINTELLGEMRHVLLPILLESMQKLRLPVIEGTTKKMDFRVEDMVFSTYDLLPENIKLKTKNQAPLKSHTTGRPVIARPHLNHAALTFKLHHMQTRMENIRYWFRRNSFPKVEDSGLVDVAIVGGGFNLKVKTLLRTTSSTPKFTVSAVKVRIDRLDIKFHDAKYDWLLNAGTKLFRKRIQRQMELQIENRIREYGVRMEKALNRALKRFPPEKLRSMAHRGAENVRAHHANLQQGSNAGVPVESKGEALRHGMDRIKEKVKEKTGLGHGTTTTTAPGYVEAIPVGTTSMPMTSAPMANTTMMGVGPVIPQEKTTQQTTTTTTTYQS